MEGEVSSEDEFILPTKLVESENEHSEDVQENTDVEKKIWEYFELTEWKMSTTTLTP